MKYYVNVPQIAKGKFPKYMKFAAKIILDKGYFSVGDFFQGLSTAELDKLMTDLADQEQEVQDRNMLLTCLLSIGESLDIEFTDDEEGEDWNKWADIISTRFEMLAKYAFFESLTRKGYLKAYHSNWTLDYTDEGDRIVVEALNDGITDIIKHLLGNQNGNGL